ncbi:MAG: hypothetical protein IPK76_10750 [Lewinellaceae bacterium]|nr:hypothetical protein [Lewinellaceae bacterium]
MKYFGQILFAAFLFTALAAQAQSTDSTLIEVRIEGISAGKTRLVGVFGDRNYLADSAEVDATGRFTLRRKSPLPAGFTPFCCRAATRPFRCWSIPTSALRWRPKPAISAAPCR